MLNKARNHASVMRLSPPLMTISQRRDPNHQRPESIMQTEYDPNSIKVGKGHRHDSHLYLHLKDSRFPWTVLANLRSTAQQMWKRSYTLSPSKENGQKNNKYLSTGGEVALILTLVGMIYFFYILPGSSAVSQKLSGITQSVLHSWS